MNDGLSPVYHPTKPKKLKQSPKFNLQQHLQTIPESNYVKVEHLWDVFINSDKCKEYVTTFKQIRELLKLHPNLVNYEATFSVLKNVLTNWRTKKLFESLEKYTNKGCYFPQKALNKTSKAANNGRIPDLSDYASNLSSKYGSTKSSSSSSNVFTTNNIIPQPKNSNTHETNLDANTRSCTAVNTLVVGAGPVGLRYAIEMCLLGSNVVIIEKREEFARNNVVHLWDSVVCDLKNLCIKYFYNKFVAGELNHIAIAKLQEVLLKLCLVMGADVYLGMDYKNSKHPGDDRNRPWKPITKPELPLYCPCFHRIDILIGADGKRTKIPGFDMKHLKGAPGTCTSTSVDCPAFRIPQRQTRYAC